MVGLDLQGNSMDLKELQERQRWSLPQKIDHALFTIETFISRTNGQCYVAFSGGKDSSVLLDLVRIIDKTIPAVFVNTGNEYPDIIKFVRHLRDDKGYNIIELHPKMTPRQVWAKYGFPLISKAQAEYIDRWRKNPEYAAIQQARAAERGWSFGKVSDRWKYLITEPYATSNECCTILKKNPSKSYAKETGRHPILGTWHQNPISGGLNISIEGVAIHLERNSGMDSGQLLSPFGWMRTYGDTSGKETWRSVMSITRGARGQDVLDVALVVMQPMMRDSGFCSNSIPSIMRW